MIARSTTAATTSAPKGCKVMFRSCAPERRTPASGIGALCALATIRGDRSGVWSRRHRSKPAHLHLRSVAPRPNPTASIPDGAQLHQLLFSKQRSGDERIQMIGALNHATTAAEIPLDRVMAPTQLLRDLAAGYALETCLRSEERRVGKECGGRREGCL